MTALLPNLLHFAEVLRGAGLPVSTARMIDAATALGHVDLRRKSDFYFTLRALLLHRHEDEAIFEDAFRIFWRKPAGERTTRNLQALGERRRIGPPERSWPSPGEGGEATSPTVVQRVVPFSSSTARVSREKDFATFSIDELREAQRLIEALTWRPGMRPTRRMTPARQGVLDLRRVAAQAAKGADVLIWPRRARVHKPRPLIVLCDISGSMERYTRMFLHFVHALARTDVRIEAFLFATELTRVTRHLAQTRADAAVPRMLRDVTDWGGGTRIGEALRTFNTTWRRRIGGTSPVVLLISDGWDRGEPEDLRREMARLRRSCRRLIWLNPLLGSPDYQPITRGMQAALPFVDDFLPVHNLASLESLAAHLNRLPARRSASRHTRRPLT